MVCFSGFFLAAKGHGKLFVGTQNNGAEFASKKAKQNAKR